MRGREISRGVTDVVGQDQRFSRQVSRIPICVLSRRHPFRSSKPQTPQSGVLPSHTSKPGLRFTQFKHFEWRAPFFKLMSKQSIPLIFQKLSPFRKMCC